MCLSELRDVYDAGSVVGNHKRNGCAACRPFSCLRLGLPELDPPMTAWSCQCHKYVVQLSCSSLLPLLNARASAMI